MNIGIFTYGTRGDLQPYIALALGLIQRGHEVSIAATEDFREFVESFGIRFRPLWGNAEVMMNSPEGQSVLKAQNTLKLMQYYFKVLHQNRVVLRESYYKAVSEVDYVIANSMTIPIVSAIVEQQKKKLALTYFMPPVVPTSAFPLADFDFFDFPCYNKLTYQLAQFFFWRFIKDDTNEYRRVLGLPKLKLNLVKYLDRQKILDLYCLSQHLIPRPSDWQDHHKITGFLHIPEQVRGKHTSDQTSLDLATWLQTGSKPIYIGFGSNSVGNSDKITSLILEVLNKTNERILFCTGWSIFNHLPEHKNLFIIKYVNHETVLPYCKLGVFHGGAGTLAAMLRHSLPVIIISLYTDQPTWGKIVVKKKLGMHIPAKRLTPEKLIAAIKNVQSEEIRSRVTDMGQKINMENGLDNAISEIENYFSSFDLKG